MNCKKINRDLIFFAEGSITGSRNEEINRHLSECKICRDFVRELTYNLEIIEKEKKAEANPFLYSKIYNKIISNEQPANVLVTSAVKVLRPVFITLLILSGIFSGFKLGSYLSDKYSYSDSELQTITYYLNDLQHESVETILLYEELEN
jgi:predicted anti-sigma-YlaC factor YlaD